MPRMPYNRELAVEYARRWALDRNPRFYDYSEIGGDCTNFASQCLYAGSKIMNYASPLGWYFINADHRSASWTGVQYLYNFLTRPTGVGPLGHIVPMEDVEAGDISQFAGTSTWFTHSQVIVSVGAIPTLENILVCTHSLDSLDRPLSTYYFKKIRFIHINGVNK